MQILSSSYKKLTVSSFAAGVSIGIAGIAYLKTGNAWVFPIGLYMVCFFGLHLYTGRVCYAKLIDAPELLWMIIMNFIGAGLLGILCHFVYPELAQKAAELTAAKINQDMRVFPRAFLCNVMIFVAVHSWKNIPSPNNIIGLIFATAIFVMCGFEHCVANAFYFGCAFNHNIEMIWYLPACALGNTIGGLAAHQTAKCVGWR